MDTRVIAVTVYPDRARVTRAGRAALETGLHKVEIENLPLHLVPDSVRASGRGTARAKLLGVSTRMEHFQETPAEAARELELKLQAAQDFGAELGARITVLEKEQKHLEGLGAQSEMFARGLALRGQTVEQQGAVFSFIGSRLGQIQSEILKIGREQRENNKLIEQLKRQLQAVQSARPKQRYVAAVELEVSAPGDLDVELVYVVTGARWAPLYDLRVGEAAIDVTYLAQVTQHTGEDWLEAALTLSTAQPALSLTIPELDPWYVQPLPPPMPKRMAVPVPRGGMPLPAAAPAPQAFGEEQALLAVAASAPELADVEAEAASVSASGAALTYKLSGRADVPGNGDPRKVTIATFPLKPALDYVTAPKLEAACYRRAKVKNDSPYTLLAGRAQLFEGDDFLGTTEMEFSAPNREFELFLGADERLPVERELTQREVDKAFIIGDRKRIRYGYEIEIENLRDAPQTVYVRDQLPVSRDEQIKVRLESAEPKPSEHDDLNLLEWKLTLAPAAKQKVRFEFTVEHPRALTVMGLPE
jgi:uncharacterized protein (TIGR02231 family)